MVKQFLMFCGNQIEKKNDKKNGPFLFLDLIKRIICETSLT